MERNADNTANKPQRDTFLDVVRTISTIRVVVWHTFGLPLISYFVAAMPAMFFVFGSLLAASADRKPLHAVVLDRFRRILGPLWLFVIVTWLFAFVTWGAWRGFSPLEALRWLVPFNDPPAQGWEQGWLSSPLWFMRTMFWLLLASPVWLFAVRRLPRLTIAAGVAAIFATDWAAGVASLRVSSDPQFWWKAGDIALYGTFAVAGACTHRWAHRLSRVRSLHWVNVALGAAISAAVWSLTHDVHLHVVNNSHPLHLFVGLGWLALAFAARGLLVKASARRAIGAVVRTVNARSMTIYLWHTTIVAAVVWLLPRLSLTSPWNEWLLRIAFVAVGVAVAVAAFGWAEDVAAGRRARVWPARITWDRRAKLRATWTGSIATALAFALATSTTSVAPQATTVPPIPSQQPPAPEFVQKAEPVDMSPLSAEEVQRRIEERLQAWHAETGDQGAFVSAMTLDDLLFQAAVGTRKDSAEPIGVDDEFDMASITKFLTASMLFRLVDQGLIDLDAPLPPLEAVPDFQYRERLTPRMLLTHRSGLVNYRDTDIYQADKSLVSSPADAVRASGGMPLMNEPGTETHYSSVNFLVLGFLIEQVTQRSYDDLFKEEIVDGIGLRHTRSVPPSPGEPSGATAGTMTTLYDLLVATKSILHDKTFTSDNTYAQMLNIDTQSGLGAGAIGFCPCIENPDGTKSFTSYGHYGGDTIAVYVPSTGVVVGMHSTWTIHEERWHSTESLINDIAVLAARAQAPATV